MRTERQELRWRLSRLAATQRGYFTAAQALQQGYSHQAQKFHADRGNWERVERGLYRLPDWPVGNDDHLVRWMLWSRRRAVVSHATALGVHQLGDVDPARIHLTVPPGFRQRPAESVVLHWQEVPDTDIEEREGYRVTTPTRTIADCAAESLGQELLDGAVTEALAQGVTTRRMLRDGAARNGPRAEAGVERALAVVPL